MVTCASSLRFVLLLFFVGMLPGCYTYHAARDVGFLALERDTSPGKEMGVLKGYNCGLRVLGFGPGAKITKAFNMLREREDVRYLSQARVYLRNKSWGFASRDCWIIRGIGFK